MLVTSFDHRRHNPIATPSLQKKNPIIYHLQKERKRKEKRTHAQMTVNVWAVKTGLQNLKILK
jgi:hypothetical protein